MGFWRWMRTNVLWDTSGGLTGLWPARKVLAALLLSLLLTWGEWAKNHPPEIVLVAVLHFVFLLAIVAGVVYALQWTRRGT